jgi:hypothetical protein
MSEFQPLQAVPSPTPTIAQSASADTHPTQEARCLLGWMDPAAGVQLLTMPPSPITPAEAQAAVAAATWAVNARLIDNIDQADAIKPLPPTLEPYIEQLRAEGGLVPTFMAQGWTPGMVDLRMLHAFQPVVFHDGVNRVGEIDPSDLIATAEVTIPRNVPTSIKASFDERSRAWVASSPNPNLRVVDVVRPEAAPTFGFVIGITPSVVQVIRSHGRLLLHDGYHRSVGLLRRGIYHVPALIWDNPLVDQLVPAGMLPPASYLGDRPPCLADYLDDVVAHTVHLPRTTKTVIVTATEVNIAS